RLAVAPLFVEDILIVVGAEHPLARRRRVNLSDLRDARWILLKPGSVTRQTIIDSCATLGFHPQIAFECSSLSPVRALASANLGFAVLQRSVAEAEGPPVSMVRIEHPSLTRTVGIVWRAGGSHSRAAAAFLDFVRAAEHGSASAEEPGE